MPNLADRKMLTLPTCRWCKHCLTVKVETDEGDTIEHYCMLGASEEDIQYIDNEIFDELDGYIPRLSDFSERFCQIMQIEGYCDLWDTPRYVECTDCCNYYQEPAWEED